MTTSITRKAWGLQEIAELLGLSQGFLRKEIRSGNLVPTRLGRRILVTDRELTRYLDEASSGSRNTQK